MFEAQLKGSICAWCVNGCTNATNNKCEPKAFLDGKELAEPGSVKDYETCLNGNDELNSYTYFDKMPITLDHCVVKRSLYVLAEPWILFGEEIECTGTKIDQGWISSRHSCAAICSSLATMSIYGINAEVCNDEGCKCWCETAAGYGGTCTTKANAKFNLYRFTNSGMLSLP